MTSDLPFVFKIDSLQSKLGYKFKDVNLLEVALTHPSVNKSVSYERLEFVGDRVLGLVISEYLYKKYSYDEGKLAKHFNHLICKSSCADAARIIDLGKYLYLASSEEDTGGRDKNTVLGDACEALIAAIYLDSDLNQVRSIIMKLWQKMLAKPVEITDPKSKLQEWSQSLNLGLPVYKLVSKEGPDHQPIFVVMVSINNQYTQNGTGKSKRLAEQDAAEKLLKIIDDNPNDG